MTGPVTYVRSVMLRFAVLGGLLLLLASSLPARANHLPPGHEDDLGAFTDAYLMAQEHNAALIEVAPDYDAALDPEQNGDMTVVIDYSTEYAILLEQAIADWDTLDVRACFAPFWSDQRASWRSALEMVKYNVNWRRAIERGTEEEQEATLEIVNHAFAAAKFFARLGQSEGMAAACDGDPQNMLDKMGVETTVTTRKVVDNTTVDVR